MSASGAIRHLLHPRPYPITLSLVFPMQNEQEMVPQLRVAVTSFMGEVGAHTEIILVNDGSTDTTLDQIVAWASEDGRVKVVDLSRNFGHQIAATAGLDFASGEVVVLLDADLQDPLCVVHEMIERYCEGYDVAYGQRERRAGETVFKRCTAWLFYRLMSSLVMRDLPVDTGDFRLVSRRCLDGLRQMREVHRFLRGMTAWVGYPQVAVRYQRLPRCAGETKYPLRKMLAFAWTAATSFSTVPLRVSSFVGLIVFLLSIEEGLRSVVAHLFGWYTSSGWSSLMVAVTGIGGMLLVSVGILGEYVGKIYEQAKDRPIYMVAETYNVQERSESRAKDSCATY